MKIAQIAPIDRRARYSKAPRSVWPLRGVDGLTFAERKAKDSQEAERYERRLARIARYP
jgi:hypothetical protein